VHDTDSRVSATVLCYTQQRMAAWFPTLQSALMRCKSQPPSLTVARPHGTSVRLLERAGTADLNPSIAVPKVIAAASKPVRGATRSSGKPLADANRSFVGSAGCFLRSSSRKISCSCKQVAIS
jgi:hypothetical protein